MTHIQKQMIAAGVKQLRENGYPTANEQNITTDYLFASFFITMIEDTIEDLAKFHRFDLKREAESLLENVKKTRKPL